MFCSCMTSDKQSWTCNSETTRKKNSETTPNNSERIPNPKQPEKKIAPVCGFLRTVCGFFAPVCVFDFLRNVPKLSEIVRKYSEMYSELVSESVRKYPEFYSELVPESVWNKRPLYLKCMSCPGKWILSHQVRISHYCSTKFFMKFIHGTKPWLRNTRGFALPQIVENFEQLCVTPCIIQWKPVEQLSVRNIFCNTWLSPAWAR